MIDTDFYSRLCFAEGSTFAPSEAAQIKTHNQDFIVEELMDVEFSGEGEHIWLNISKSGLHTDQIVKKIAQLSGVAYRDIGFSGMKDFRANTSQWFSVWLPGVVDDKLPDWSLLESEKSQVNQIIRHSRKLKRGTHFGNAFRVFLRDFSGSMDSFNENIHRIQSIGVPNYFGQQRFGRAGSNLLQAEQWLKTGQRIKQRQKRSMLLSSARSWLFNCVLSERLKTKTWLIPFDKEPLCLSGSKQFFVSDDGVENKARIHSGDIHTSSPLWGNGQEKVLAKDSEIGQFEMNIINDHPQFRDGLLTQDLQYTRRANRFMPQNLTRKTLEDGIELSFTLGKGQFATSLLRELVQATNT